ncbi:zf-CHY type zinc finger protein [Schizosaccharomyces japonicus yFS275]|uniref:Zf-CHY type zinc finger protein n=1 Tax=Schizosaccharomyces japonicus (strain yFS275 / FY16936) TaxID=402676 RepID=B6K475_SCHJY|nr:zf-CHY type zinc finger protein [Schizosaccharomyces japonicus yFS275]EEB08282.2 zf-CHY type zinc finger protein [Schizosaccharomyces japonicus yFS275]
MDWQKQVNVFQRRMGANIINANSEVFLVCASDFGDICMIVSKIDIHKISFVLSDEHKDVEEEINTLLLDHSFLEHRTLLSVYNYLIYNWDRLAKDHEQREREKGDTITKTEENINVEKKDDAKDYESIAKRSSLSEKLKKLDITDQDSSFTKAKDTQYLTKKVSLGTLNGELQNDLHEIKEQDTDTDGDENDNEDEDDTAFGDQNTTKTEEEEDMVMICSELTGLNMVNIGLMRFPTLKLVVKCSRCRYGTECSVQKKFTGVCSRCTFNFVLQWKMGDIHAHSTRAGTLRALGCVPLDLLPLNAQCTCLECVDEVIVLINGLSSAQKMTKFCVHCTKNLSVEFQTADFHLLKLRTGSQKVNTKSAKKFSKQNLGIVRGKPLPNNGACAHYRKSHRWFRFSCCNRIYPCCECHDMDQDHPHEQANRIICGFCSMESLYTPSKPCPHCGNFTTRQQLSAFWEGGKGMRDRVRMSRKDPRKYKRL